MITRKTDSFGPIELAAERRGLAADAVLVEVVPLRAFGTEIFDPSLAAIVIGDGDDIVKSDARRSRIITTEVSREGAEGKISVDRGEEEEKSERDYELSHLIIMYNQNSHFKQISSAYPILLLASKKIYPA